MDVHTILSVISLFPKSTSFRIYAIDLRNQHSKFLFQIESSDLFKRQDLLGIKIHSLACYRRESDTMCIYVNKHHIKEGE